MKQIDSNALDLLNRSLGLYGPGAQVQLLDDSIVSLVMDITKVVARGRELVAKSMNLFWFVIRNTHGAGGTDVATTLSPYEAAAVTQGYPSPVPEGWDLEILSLGLSISAAATFTNAAFGQVGSVMQGPEKNLAAFGTPIIEIFRTTDIVTAAGGGGKAGRVLGTPFPIRRDGAPSGSSRPEIVLQTTATGVCVIDGYGLLRAYPAGTR